MSTSRALLDELERADLDLELHVHSAIVARVMKLNKAELLTLAKHYRLGNLDLYRDGWQSGGKLDLCHELAERMADDPRALGALA